MFVHFPIILCIAIPISYTQDPEILPLAVPINQNSKPYSVSSYLLPCLYYIQKQIDVHTPFIFSSNTDCQYLLQ